MHLKKKGCFLSYLRVFLCWPLQDGWGGGAGAGMQSDAQGDRNMKRSFHWFSILKKKTADGCKNIPASFQSSPVFTGIRLLYLMLLVMLTALHPRFFFIYRSDGSQKAAPRLSSPPNPGQTAGGRCWADRCKPLLLLLHSSASHTAELSTSRGLPPPPTTTTTACQEEVRVQTSIIITDMNWVLHSRLKRNKNIRNVSLGKRQLDHLTQLLLHILYK